MHQEIGWILLSVLCGIGLSDAAVKVDEQPAEPGEWGFRPSDGQTSHVNPPGFVAQVVAFAFGLAASSFFPAIVLGIFSKRMNKEGAISGMVTGILFTASYIIYFKFINPAANKPDNWWFGISPEGIGSIGMVINFVVALLGSRFTAPPPASIQYLVEDIRMPRPMVKMDSLHK